MILSYFRRGAGGRPACVRFESGGLAGRQLLLDFEEDQLCVVREVRRRGYIGGQRPWAASGPVCRVWPGGGAAAESGVARADPDNPGDCA